MICDYNGWNDAPEDEREWFDEHPEIWEATARATEVRRIRTSGRFEETQFRGDLAA